MIGVDKPSENTLWRMVAILAYSLDIEFAHDAAPVSYTHLTLPTIRSV